MHDTAFSLPVFKENSLYDSLDFARLYFPRYKVAITKQKDSEQSCGSLYNQNGIRDPAIDFSKYIEDNESIVNEVCVGLSYYFKT